MSRPATTRLKVNPQLGRMPTLQFCRPAELRIDPAYQRDVANSASQALIRRIAQHWNWDLCLPLVVARRTDLTERLFVIDGQHRLEAARMRGDIDQLPCVIVTSAGDEAASFVHLNQQRRALTKLDLFKAAVASDDAQALAIMAALGDAGLSVAPHSNHTAWKPGMVSNLPGIEHAWRTHGPRVTAAALRVMGQAFGGQVLQYAGSIFPGVAAVCADELVDLGRLDEGRLERLQTMLARRGQRDWRSMIIRMKAEQPTLNYLAVSAASLRRAWAGEWGAAVSTPHPPEPQPLPVEQFSGQRWCEQCDMRVAHPQAAGCKSRHCSLRKVAA